MAVNLNASEQIWRQFIFYTYWKFQILWEGCTVRQNKYFKERERNEIVWVQRHIDMYFHLLVCVCVFTKYKHVGCQLLFALSTEKMCAYFRHHFEYSLQRFSPELWHLCIPLKASFQNIFSPGRTGWRTKDKVAGQLLKRLQYEISGAQSYQPVGMI